MESSGDPIRDATKDLTPDALDKMRSVALAGAGFCAALLLLVLQDESLRGTSHWALVFACTGMPLLLAAAFMVESYMLHGERSYRLQPHAVAYTVMILSFFIGGACLVAALFAFIQQFSEGLAWYFLAISTIAVVVTCWHSIVTKPRTSE